MTLDQFQQLRHWHLCHRYDHPLEGRIWSTLVTLWMIGWVGTPTAWLLHWDWTAAATALFVFVPGAYVAWKPATVATPRLLFAHADWSGYSVFEEAFIAGCEAIG